MFIIARGKLVRSTVRFDRERLRGMTNEHRVRGETKAIPSVKCARLGDVANIPRFVLQFLPPREISFVANRVSKIRGETGRGDPRSNFGGNYANFSHLRPLYDISILQQ